MKNYDIGIYTFWDVPNYGTFIQSYALQKSIAQMFPERDVVQIAHLDKRHYSFYYSMVPCRNFLSLNFYKQIVHRLCRKKEIEGKKELFQKSYRTINHTEEITYKNMKDIHFNIVILGSDIIWDYTQSVFNNDELLFGNHFNCDKVFSYAASFGVAKLNEKLPKYALSGLEKMSSISVRDEKSAEIIKKNLDFKPDIVLDPTWLCDFKNDDSIVKPDMSEYIVVYGQDFSDKFIDELIEYSKQTNLKLLCLDCNDDSYDWCDIIIPQSSLTPFEWVGYFMNANAVATSTFHGLTFGLIFNKKLAFCKTDFIMAKAHAFLQELGLLNVYENDDSSVEKMMSATEDYQRINEVLGEKRESSYTFLKKNIESKISNG